MARRKKKQAEPKPRLARDLHVETGLTTVENPNWSRDKDGEPGYPRYITPDLNVKESAIETLYARHELTRLQKKAADTFREHYEAYAAESVSAIDYSRDHVDSTSTKAPVTHRRMKARQELGRCKAEIGTRNYRLLVSICGQGKSFSELFPYFNEAKPDPGMKRARLTAADNLRDALYDVAMMWGLATGNAQRKRKAAA